MSVSLSNGKVFISENTITIKRTFGEDVIQKKQIKSVDKQGGLFWAIWWTLWIISILKAIPLYMGKCEVTIKTHSKEYTFYILNSEYNTLRENL